MFRPQAARHYRRAKNKSCVKSYLKSFNKRCSDQINCKSNASVLKLTANLIIKPFKFLSCSRSVYYWSHRYSPQVTLCISYRSKSMQLAALMFKPLEGTVPSFYLMTSVPLSLSAPQHLHFTSHPFVPSALSPSLTS